MGMCLETNRPVKLPAMGKFLGFTGQLVSRHVPMAGGFTGLFVTRHLPIAGGFTGLLISRHLSMGIHIYSQHFIVPVLVFLLTATPLGGGVIVFYPCLYLVGTDIFGFRSMI
jgi:hypothetical protein